MTKLVFDYDFIIFKAACAVENRFVRVKNKKDGSELIFKNRTEVYGNYRKKEGGWLSKQEGLTLDDIEIEDDREVEPLANALQIAKRIILDVCKQFDTTDYYGYASGDSNFRKDICTLLPYKGNRENMLPPIHRGELKKYLVKYHNCIVTNGNEPDDMVVTDMYSALKNKEKLIGVIIEKDYYGCEGDWFNYDSGDLTKVRGFGALYREGSKVKGYGRMWKYFQVCFADTSDNYAANCFSDQKNGEVAVYNRLVNCKNDKEAFLAMKEHFQHLYPEPKVIQNWKGEEVQIDWMYVLQEMFNLAHLQRWKDDRVNVIEAFRRLEIET